MRLAQHVSSRVEGIGDHVDGMREGGRITDLLYVDCSSCGQIAFMNYEYYIHEYSFCEAMQNILIF